MPLPPLYRNWHKNNVHTSHSKKQDDMAKYDRKMLELQIAKIISSVT
jgi:hypothetical protein